MRLLKCHFCKGTGYFPNRRTWIGSGLKKRQSCSVCEGLKKIAPLTEADQLLVRQAAYGAWNAIAPDLDDVERMSNRDVVEVVMDADHMVTFGVDTPAEKQRLRQLTRGLSATKHRVIKRWVHDALN